MSEIRVIEFSVSEIRTDEFRSTKKCVITCRICKVRTKKLGASKFRIIKIRAAKVHTTKFHTVEPCSAKGNSRQVWQLFGVFFSPLIPNQHTLVQYF